MTLFGLAVITYYTGAVVAGAARRLSLQKIFVLCLTMTCCLEINELSGYLFKVGSRYELTYSEFGVALTAIIGVAVVFEKRVDRKFLSAILAFLFFILFGLALEIVFPSNVLIMNYSGSWDRFFYGRDLREKVNIGVQSAMMLTRCIIIVVLLAAGKSCWSDKKGFNNMVRAILASIKLHIVFCLFEWITKNIFHLGIASDIQTWLLGIGKSTYVGLSIRGGSAAIQGLTREPSHLSSVLFWFIAFLILTDRIRSNKKWIVLTLFIWLTSGSFAMVMYIAILAALYVIYERIAWNTTVSRKYSLKKLVIIMAFIAAIVVFALFVFQSEYFMERIGRAIGVLRAIVMNEGIAGIRSSSESARIYGAYYSIVTTLLHRPLLGFGIGTSYAHSGIACGIGQIGILGLWAWYRMLERFVDMEKIKNRKQIEGLLLAVLILPNILKGGIDTLYVTWMLPLLYACMRKAVYMNEEKIHRMYVYDLKRIDFKRREWT